jgi:hypothetical protein
MRGVKRVVNNRPITEEEILIMLSESQEKEK